MDIPQFRLSFLHPKYWLLWLGFGLLRLLSFLPYKTLILLGGMLGVVILPFARSRRKIIQRNLELCFPQKNVQQINLLVRENFANMGIALFETAMAWWWPLESLQNLAKIDGLQHLTCAKQKKQGVILLAMHFTTLEIGAALLGLQHSIDGMYRTHDNPLFDWLQRSGRERHNSDAVAVERADVRSTVRLLRKGRAIWYAPDQDYGREHSLFVPLFGINAATITATSSFARLGKAVVLPFTQQRLKDGSGYYLQIHAPWTDFPGKSEQQDCLRINQWLEQIISEHPEQYLWAHRRFKTRLKGEPSLYLN